MDRCAPGTRSKQVAALAQQVRSPGTARCGQGAGRAPRATIPFHARSAALQTSEKEMLTKNRAGDCADVEGDEDVIYKIDIPANRYDMLCVEGIARALNIFNGTMPSPQYTLADMT
eukprot:363566-Chlamydomonas_euryale.AAC.11